MSEGEAILYVMPNKVLQDQLLERIVPMSDRKGDVVCNKTHECDEAYMCGGASLHIYDESECGQCVRYPDARCIDAGMNRGESDGK